MSRTLKIIVLVILLVIALLATLYFKGLTLKNVRLVTIYQILVD